jgi:hypothetical protein
MKKLALLLILVLGIFSEIQAQYGNEHLIVSGGIFTNEVYHARVGFEFSRRYHNSIGITGDIYFLERYNQTELLLTPSYSQTLIRSKNINLKLPIEVGIGTNNSNFLTTLGSGLELNFITTNYFVFHLRQMNQVAFGSNQRWRFGLQAGFKIPL